MRLQGGGVANQHARARTGLHRDPEKPRGEGRGGGALIVMGRTQNKTLRGEALQKKTFAEFGFGFGSRFV